MAHILQTIFTNVLLLWPDVLCPLFQIVLGVGRWSAVLCPLFQIVLGVGRWSAVLCPLFQIVLGVGRWSAVLCPLFQIVLGVGRWSAVLCPLFQIMLGVGRWSAVLCPLFSDSAVCRQVICCVPFIIPPNNEVVGGYIGFTPSVCLSVRLSRLPCPLCNIYSSGWILSILATNDHYHERVCHTQWPLTLTYIFKVIRPWLRRSCPLCSVYSSGWILSIFGTNDH